MDADLRELLYRRRLISSKLLDELRAWDKSVESAVEILDRNEARIRDLKDIDGKLSSFNKEASFDEKYEENIRDILLLNKSLLKSIEREQHRILKNIKEMNKTKDVRDSYVSSKRESMFIDRNI